MKLSKKADIRRMQWIARLVSSVLISSPSRLRKLGGEGARVVIGPQGLDWKQLEVNGIPCETLTPAGASKDAIILYLHGGGGVLGLYNTSRRIIAHVSAASKLGSIFPDYRLAPEFPFPAGLEDCLAVYRGLLSEGYDPKKIVVLGDSMGGYLTVSMLLYLRDNHLPLPGGAVCISPVTDPTCSGASMRANAKKDALLSPKFLRGCMEFYVGSHRLEDPLLSPLVSDLSGLPPMLIQAGEDEILLDDARRLHQRGLSQGVEMRLEVWPRMWHDWHVSAPDLQESNEAIAKIAEFVRSVIGDQ